MDQEQLKQKIAEYFGKLPKEAQVVFSSMTWVETLKNIGTKYSLNDNQIEILGTETTLVLLGIVHVEEYKETVEKELGLEKEIVGKIMTEIDENILKTIKDQLVGAFESNAVSLAEEAENNSLATEEIPLPPYAMSGKQEVVSSEEEKDSSKEQVVNSNKEEAPKLIEVKPEPTINTTPTNIIEEKLKSATASDHTVSDYSTPKTHDPYRESF